jgi:hypothetical protein
MRKNLFASIYSIVGLGKALLRRAHHNQAQSLRREVGGHAIESRMRATRWLCPAYGQPQFVGSAADDPATTVVGVI